MQPDTDALYAWVGVPLNPASMRDLPEWSESVMDEILAMCEGGTRAEPFDTLRSMAWAGVGGGGHTHDTCVSAVASLVARGWTDTQIHERIEFATREACGRAQLEYDGPGSARAIQEWIHSARKKVWLGECCEPTTNPKDYASNDALWNAYNAWALRHGGSETSRHTSIITWGKAMTRLGYPAVNARRGHEYVKARKLMLKRHPSTRDGEPGY